MARSSLRTETYVLHPDESYPLYICAQRYWADSQDSPVATDRDDGLTLILLHAASFHKETWKPTLEVLFSSSRSPHGSDALGSTDWGNVWGVQNGLHLPSRDRDPCFKIREAWSIECPNHGQSAVLNETILPSSQYSDKMSSENYARAAHRLLGKESLGLLKGHRLVGIGHSLGGTALAYLLGFEHPIEFHSAILIEPMLSPNGSHHIKLAQTKYFQAAYEKKDTWPTRKAARKTLEMYTKLPVGSAWNQAIFDLYIEHALRPHPGAKYEICPYNGLTLCCTREQEATHYRDDEGATKPLPALKEACNRMPVHMIYGDINDSVPRSIHDAFLDDPAQWLFASATRMKGVGHMVPQVAPTELASILLRILAHDGPNMLHRKLPEYKSQRASAVAKL